VVTYGQKEQREAKPSSIVKLGKDGTIQIIRK